MKHLSANPLKILEVSTGIEPVYTDLQSNAFPNEINTQGPKKYQDKAGTGREPDTSAQSDLTNENPGAAATATGAENVYEAGQLPPFDSPEWAGAPAIILRHFCGVAA